MIPNVKQTDSINSKYMIHKTDVSTQNNRLDMRYRIPPDLIYSLFLE